MEDFPHVPTIYIISGGIGSSGEQLVNTVLAQFQGQKVDVQTVGSVRKTEQIASILALAKRNEGIVVHTLVDSELRQFLKYEARRIQVEAVDMVGPLSDWLAKRLGKEPLNQPGLYRQLHREYFARVKAIEYTLAHDDGKNPNGWPEAEIVLLGVSRVGKTPLSIYLSVLGWKVANIPLVPQVQVNEMLHTLDPRRVIGLMIEPDQLLLYRRSRQAKLGVAQTSDYMETEAVQDELESARLLYRRGGYTIVDMTMKTIEQGADEVLRKIQRRI